MFSELLGTFFLVLVASGGGVMSHAFPNTISRGAALAVGCAWILRGPGGDRAALAAAQGEIAAVRERVDEALRSDEASS